MLTEDDIRAAIAEGILTEDQAARLMAFTRQRQGGQAAYASRDEPFRLFRGFRDFFLAIGLVILAVGLAGGVATFFAGAMPGLGSTTRAEALRLMGPTAGLAALAWLMAEWVTARLRLPLASIVIVVCFYLAAGWFGGQVATLAGSSYKTQIGFYSQVWAALFALGAAIAFYIRFRLPFVLLPLAGAAVATTVAVLTTFAPMWLDANVRLVSAIAGVVVFVAAMRYDMSDPNRLTRRAECGFWLHLLAAPLIVHSIVGGLTGSATVSAPAIIALIAVLAVIALAVDRRALLVSALIYLATAISRTISDVTILSENAFVTTALILGLIVVSLGLGWTPARNALIRLFPEDSAVRRALPPAS
ncbi:MAG: hypothetical protein KDJ77_16775 [Rhodobiaceae bacterium]|nr:hypothetical protein [Rhodobiaceae bacterium]